MGVSDSPLRSTATTYQYIMVLCGMIRSTFFNCSEVFEVDDTPANERYIMMIMCSQLVLVCYCVPPTLSRGRVSYGCLGAALTQRHDRKALADKGHVLW